MSEGFKDTHNKLMEPYADLSERSFAIYLFFLSIASIIVCQVTPFFMPWWASLLAIVMGALLTIPIGMIQAVTGEFNLIYRYPNRPECHN
jgi:hypothetical protein